MSLFRRDFIILEGNKDAETGISFKNTDKIEIHHGAIHNTNASSKAYPNFLKSALCQYTLKVRSNDTHNQSFGRMPEGICSLYEVMLSSMKCIRDSEYCRNNKLMLAVFKDILNGGNGDIKSEKE